jgi:hypothetical protein
MTMSVPSAERIDPADVLHRRGDRPPSWCAHPPIRAGGRGPWQPHGKLLPKRAMGVQQGPSR